MRRQYSPKIFLRQVPNHLLRIFFTRRNVLADIPWELQDEKEIAMVYDAWQALPAAQRADVDRVFQAVHEMACEDGVRTLIEEGKFQRVDLAAALERYDGFYHKAMWAYLTHSAIFSVAALFISADGLSRRYWLKQKSLPKKLPDISKAAVQKLAGDLSEYYRTTQGRGHHCTVEHFLRGGRQYYFFAYTDDYTDTFIGHDEQGALIKRAQRCAFEVVFVYDPHCGTLDLHVQGDYKVRARLQYIFCTAILHVNPPPEQPGDHPYELNGLLRREFPLPTDPADGIESVRVIKLRLSLGQRRITLEAAPKGAVGDIYDLMSEYLNAAALPHAPVNVTQAEFRIRLERFAHD